jgi:LysR family transcriptional regulator, cys regulon transcriptional activator
MTLTGLRCLVQIVDANLNITAASEALHLSQPCVSRHLKQVEDALGFRVFARRGRTLMDITPAGTQAIEVARRVVQEVDGLRSYAANARGDLAGELSIAAPQTYALYVLPPLLRRLRELYPDLGVSVLTLGEGERVRPLEHCRCDIVLASTAGHETVEGASIAIPLFRWKRVVIVRRDHPLARQRTPVTLAQLAACPLITYEASRRPGSSLRRVLGAAGLQPRFSCSAHDTDTLKAYARAGLGVGLVAELSLSAADRRQFAVLAVDPAVPDCTAWAVLPEGRVLRDPTRDLVRLLAPQLDAGALRRASQGTPPAQWPDVPLHAGRMVAQAAAMSRGLAG